jgi:molecular chaperone Hsp33
MENDMQEVYKDYMVRATAMDGEIRAFAVTSKDTVETARQIHDTYPTATAALGRLLSAGLMMGADMKDDDDLITVKIDCQGPIKGLLATADRNGHVKGYVSNPAVDLPPNDKGKLDVGGALDLGVLSVIKDIGLKEPYIGQTILITGEIAEDITYYYATSEQIPSSVALGVLMNKDNTVRQAGGFMIQLMPGAGDDTAEALEKKIGEIDGITSMLDKGMSPEDILTYILGDFGLRINERTDCSYRCDCSRDRVLRALLSIGKKDLEEMIEENKDVEMECHFCGRKYIFTPEELKELVKGAEI